MGIPVMILGESGTGKSASLRKLDADSTLLIQCVNKPLPFRSVGWKPNATDSWSRIINGIQKATELGKDKVVIDDFQYMMANEFMRRSEEKGFDKFTEIGRHAWEVMMAAQSAAPNLRVYFLSHVQTDDYGNAKAKTIGKLLDEKITVEGLFTIVMRTVVTDQGYFFATKNNGSDTVKTPIGLFESERIENDLAQVDDAICEFYGIEKAESTGEEAA